MENKKLGILLIIISLAVGGLFVILIVNLSHRSNTSGCFRENACRVVGNFLSIYSIAIGIFSSILALGFYLLFFNKTDRIIIERLEKSMRRNIEDEKFEFAFKMLNPFEAEILKKVREQNGITQSTLRLRVDMSKSKLSYVLQDLEKRNLIKRIQKGKTLGIWLRI